jgi:hypothetical protein
MRFFYRLIFFLVFTSVNAWAASQNFNYRIYQDLKDDYLMQEFYHDSLNMFRDGIPSSYIKDDYNNALPLQSHELKRMPDLGFISYEVFEKAVRGFRKILASRNLNDQTLLTIVDFDKHSRKRRFFVLDFERRKVLFASWTAHAENSDPEDKGIPTLFSNVPRTQMSSVGFMLTGNTYYGQWGYSMRLIGLDPVLNSNVLSRAVVIHQDMSLDARYLAWANAGTSWGCITLPYYDSGRFYGLEDKPLNEIIIDTFSKRPSVLFVHTTAINPQTQKPYLDQSIWLK